MSFCSKLTAGLFFYLLMTYLTVGESASEPYNHEMFLKKTLHTPNPLEKMVKYAITKYVLHLPLECKTQKFDKCFTLNGKRM